MKKYSLPYGTFSITLTKSDIRILTPTSLSSEQAEIVRNKPYVKKQLATIPSEDIIKLLTDSGMEFDKDDRTEIEQLILWDAACYLKSEIYGHL